MLLFIFDYYFEDITDVKKIAKDIAFSELVQEQDAGMCAYIQKSMESGSYESGRIAPEQEIAVHHLVELFRGQSIIRKQKRFYQFESSFCLPYHAQ